VISLIYSVDLKEAGKYIILGLPLIIFPIVFSTIEIKKTEIQRILRLYVFWLVILILYSEAYTVYKLLDNNQSLNLIFRKDFSYISLGEIIGIHPPYMVLLLSFSVFYLIINFEKTGINKNIQFLILGLFYFYIIHLSSRLPMAGIFGISYILIFIKIKQKFNWVISSLSVVIVTIITILILYNVRSTRYRFQELFGMQYSNGVYIESGESKILQWSSGLEANKNFLFGNGIGDANNAIIETNLKNNLIKYAEREYNAHNQYIQTYVGLGIIGVYLLFLILYNGLIRNPNNLLKVTSVAFFFYLAIVFLSESYLERHHGLVYIAFITCMVNYKESS